MTLLGFITERKGHRLLLEALPLLPPDVSVLIAGSPITGREHRRRELEELASAMAIEDRVIFTGYVGDGMLDRVLAATDVGACPFRDVSASGSMSTWISAGTRIVASDLPAIAEYDRSCLARFVGSRREPGRRGRRDQRCARRCGGESRTRSGHPSLAEQLALPRMVERYADAGDRRPRRGLRAAPRAGRPPAGRRSA